MEACSCWEVVLACFEGQEPALEEVPCWGVGPCLEEGQRLEDGLAEEHLEGEEVLLEVLASASKYSDVKTIITNSFQIDTSKDPTI